MFIRKCVCCPALECNHTANYMRPHLRLGFGSQDVILVRMDVPVNANRWSWHHLMRLHHKCTRCQNIYLWSYHMVWCFLALSSSSCCYCWGLEMPGEPKICVKTKSSSLLYYSLYIFANLKVLHSLKTLLKSSFLKDEMNSMLNLLAITQPKNKRMVVLIEPLQLIYHFIYYFFSNTPAHM